MQLIEVSPVYGVLMIAYEKFIVLIKPEVMAQLFCFDRDNNKQIIPAKNIKDV